MPSSDEPWDMSDVRYAISLFAGWLDQLPCATLEVVADTYYLHIFFRSPSRTLHISFPPSTTFDTLRILPLGQFSSLIINLNAARRRLHLMVIDLMTVCLPELINLHDLSIGTRDPNTELIETLRMRVQPDGTIDLPNPKLKMLQGSFRSEDIPLLEGLVGEREACGAPLEMLRFTKAITKKARRRAQFTGSVECVFPS
ncbi:hypothetical protein ONZ45_g18567 [Pleurotus djamor]|nr:hypothetical protein ONZ45_g18567 [Pleurotus djamor]